MRRIIKQMCNYFLLTVILNSTTFDIHLASFQNNFRISHKNFTSHTDKNIVSTKKYFQYIL